MKEGGEKVGRHGDGQRASGQSTRTLPPSRLCIAASLCNDCFLRKGCNGDEDGLVGQAESAAHNQAPSMPSRMHKASTRLRSPNMPTVTNPGNTTTQASSAIQYSSQKSLEPQRLVSEPSTPAKCTVSSTKLEEGRPCISFGQWAESGGEHWVPLNASCAVQSGQWAAPFTRPAAPCKQHARPQPYLGRG